MRTFLERAAALGVLIMLVQTVAGCAPDVEPGPGTPEPSETPAPRTDTISFEEVAGGFDQPLYVTGAGDGSGRLFVLEKTGRAHVVAEGQRGSVFLDLSEVVSTDSEQGLLGIAFPPDFAESRTLYVSYTRRDGASVLSRFREGPAGGLPSTEEVLLTVDQPYKNHNGGMIEFGPDGYLYYGLGDGGSGGDPQGNGQDLTTLLGTMLRINVTAAHTRAADAPYAVPADNPFVGRSDARPEIWAYGLRNPWRFSFDRATGDLWIGDVGQNAWEEIDFQPADSAGGENYGWNVYEGTHTYPPGEPEPVDAAGFTRPVFEYDRTEGKSVTGGYVYRGSAIPWLAGTYVYGDFVDGRIWGLTRAADGGVENRLLAQTHFQISSFGEDDDGELYVVDYAGGIYRIVAE